MIGPRSRASGLLRWLPLLALLGSNAGCPGTSPRPDDGLTPERADQRSAIDQEARPPDGPRVDAAPAGPTEAVLTVGHEPEVILESTDSVQIRQFPFLFAHGQDLFVSISEHPDDYLDHPTDGLRVSHDRGATWPAHLQQPDFYLTSMVELPGGTLLGISYITTRVDDRTVQAHYWTSADRGASWTPHQGTVSLPRDQARWGSSSWGGFLFHRSLLRIPDGSLRATMYGNYQGEAKSRVLWVKSVDGGASWTVIGTLAYSETIGPEGCGEPVVARCADGSLLAVMRVGSATYPLQQSRSLDEGQSWSAPTPLPGIDPVYTFSVDPDLTLMSQGTLVLSYGRPGTRLLFSVDGSGYLWEHLTTTRSEMTSGYTGVREVSPDRLMVVGDHGAHWQSPPTFRIWRRELTVTRRTVPGSRIDLLAKHAAGRVTITTDLTFTEPAYPGTKPSGAIDGSVDYWHSAFRNAATVPSSYVLTLDTTYQLRTLGVCLKPGYAESADVYFSTDGVSWGAPVKSYQSARQSEVDYTVFGSPLAAKLVKVVITAAEGWPGLSELQLFADEGPSGAADTFEGDALGAVPAGYLKIAGEGGVSDKVAASGSRSLRIYDSSTSALTAYVKTTRDSTMKLLELSLYPVAAPNGILISLRGGGNDLAQAALHLGVFADGRLDCYDGASWRPLAAAGTVRFGEWNRVRVEANNPAQAAVFIRGSYVGSASRNRPVAAMDRVWLSSGSTADAGDDFYVDDLVLRP